MLSNNTPPDDLAFAILLDYSAEQTIAMLFAFGFLLIAVTGESSAFDPRE